ncbi:MAG TPA: PAS domain S-box protein, partial [Flavisolibacter sp.]|nr:PAS domain S-box protein [Flavisolibacter sp.]
MSGEAFISEQNYQQLFTQAPAPIAIYKGRELRYVFANDAYLKIFHYRDIIGKTLREAFPELEGQGYYEIIENVFSTGEPYHANETPAYIELEKQSGQQLRYYNLVYTPYRSEAGTITGVMAFGHDVTDQVEARRKNAENEQRFRNVVEQAPDPILILKGDEMVLDVANQALLDLWQVTREAIGKPFLEILPEMEAQGFMKLLLDVYQNGKTHHGFEIPAEFRRASGIRETVFFNFVYQPYREADGRITGVLVMATNATTQVGVRRRLEESETRLRIALDAAAMGTWDYNPVTNTVFCSPRTNELFGFDGKTTVTLEAILETISEEDRSAVIRAFEASLLPGSPGQYEMEYVLVNRLDGKSRNIRTQGKVVFESGGTHRFIGTVVDITEEVRAREEQRKLLTLVDNSEHLMSVLQLDGRNAYLNRAGMELLGFDSFAQVLETPISQLHTPEDLAFVEANVLPSVLNKGRWAGTMMVRHLKTGDVFPVYNNSIRIDDPKTGKPMGIGAVMRDLRPEQAAQQAIIDSERNFRSLVMQAPVGICIIKGMDLILETVNDSFLKIIGREEQVLEGKLLWEALPEVRYQGFDNLLHHVFSTGIPFYGKEYEVQLLRQGREEVIYVDFVYEPLMDFNGVISRVMVLAIEVTDKVVARKKIEYAEERARLAIESAELGAY